LQWKQDIVKKITSSWKHDIGTNMDETADNLQENQSSSTANFQIITVIIPKEQLF
jgi:hypothetical protein